MRVKRQLWWLLAASLVLAAGALIRTWQDRSAALPGDSLALERILADEGAGFASVDGEREFRFPADHGGHPEHRSEVWYVNGNLDDEQGRRFGFQLAFFRLRLRPEAIARESAWGTNQVFRAHFALTDASRGRFRSEERFSRAALGLSGMDPSPVRVWLEDWSLEAVEAQQGEAGAVGFHLRAGLDGMGLELDLSAEKPPVLPGDGELFESGPGESAFHLYLIPGLAATGTLRLGETESKVAGKAWLDRAWGTRILLSQGQIALNRFALQLTDGRDLLCLQLRRWDGSGTPIPSCLLIGVDGTTKSFRRRVIRLEPLTRWTSPLDGTSYPLSWRLELPGERLELEIAPLLEDQEIDFATRAWSGAVEVSGRSRGEFLSGRGHMELSGYAGTREGT